MTKQPCQAPEGPSRLPSVPQQTIAHRLHNWHIEMSFCGLPPSGKKSESRTRVAKLCRALWITAVGLPVARRSACMTIVRRCPIVEGTFTCTPNSGAAMSPPWLASDVTSTRLIKFISAGVIANSVGTSRRPAVVLSLRNTLFRIRISGEVSPTQSALIKPVASEALNP
jgi:hypothetical protein